MGEEGTMDFKVIVGGVIGDIPGSVKDSAKVIGLETLDAFDVRLLSWTP